MTDTIVVTTQSYPVDFPIGKTPPRAKISINGRDIGGFREIAPSAYHLVIFDPTKRLSDPSAIIFNKSLWNPANNWEHDLWWATSSKFYDFIHNQILARGNPDSLLFLIASSGFDAGMVPTPSFASLLFSCGAGPALQAWLQSPPGGSGASPVSAWVHHPVNYVFMGGSGLGFGQGFGEKFEVPAAGQSAVTTELTILLESDISTRIARPGR